MPGDAADQFPRSPPHPDGGLRCPGRPGPEDAPGGQPLQDLSAHQESSENGSRRP